MAFVVVRHPDISVPGVIPIGALEHHRLRGWFRVSEQSAENDFHLPDFAEAPDLDAPKPKKSPAAPENGEEKQ